MKTILTIFRKELIDTLRDRRTIIAMVVVPLLLFPLLIGISSKIMISQMQKAREKVLKIVLITNNNALEFREMLKNRDDVILIENLSIEDGKFLIETDSLDAMIVFDKEFDLQVAQMKSGAVTYYFKSTERGDIEKSRVEKLLFEFEKELRSVRFKNLNLDESIIQTISINEQNLASSKEKVAEILGGFLPYLFIIFCFMGSMYPAIDLAAGEKERGTLETLLTSPASRLQILIGKFGVVVLTGLTSAAVSMFGMYVGITRVREIPEELLKTILGILEPQSIIMLVSVLLPLTIFFAAILLSLSIFAKSFKEAQSIISPMMILIIVPAFIGLMPGMELNASTALIPILNVSLATKGIIAGTIPVPILLEVYASLIIYAAVSILVCTKMFEREEMIFRG